MKLYVKVLWIVLLVTSTPTALISVLYLQREWIQETKSEANALQILIATVYPPILDGYWNFNVQALETAIKPLFRVKSIQQLEVFDDKGALYFKMTPGGVVPNEKDGKNEIWELLPELYPSKSIDNSQVRKFSEANPYLKEISDFEFRLFIPLRLLEPNNVDYTVVGAIALDYTLVELREKLLQSIFYVGFLTVAFVLLLSTVMINLLRKNIIIPVNRLAKSSIKIASGDFDDSIHIDTRDEIGLLASNFEEMRVQVKNYTRILQEKNTELEDALSRLTHEVNSRVEMVQDLAHRGNNPMHAGSLALDSIEANVSLLEKMTVNLFPPKNELDTDAQSLLEQFEHKFHETIALTHDVRTSTQKVARAVQDLRVMGGVDGTSVDYINIGEVLKMALSRLAENMGPEEVKRLKFVDSIQLDSMRIVSHKIALAICLERFLRQILLYEKREIVINTFMNHEAHECLLIDFGLSELAELELLGLATLAEHLSYVLSGFRTQFRWRERKILLKSQEDLSLALSDGLSKSR